MNPIFVTSVSTFLLVAVLYIFMPYVTPRTVVFGVRIPPSRTGDPRIAKLRRSFQAGVAGASALVGVMLLVLPLIYSQPTISLGAIFVELAVAYLVYYRTNRLLERIKTEEKWYENAVESSGAVYPEEKGISMAWAYLLIIPSVVIIALTAYIGATAYPGLPAQIPTHFGTNGQPDRFSPKTPLNAFLMVYIQAGVTAMLILVGIAISRTRQELDVTRPTATSIQQEKFRMYTMEALFLLTAFVNVTMLGSSLSIWGLISRSDLLPLILAPTLIGAAIMIVGLMRIGQMGSRIHVPEHDEHTDTTVVNRNDDKYWKGGALYYNPGDSSVLVGKRFGVGWTFNFAHPVTWIIMAAIVLTAVLPLLFAFHVL